MENEKNNDADRFIETSKTQVSNIQAGEHGQFVREALKQSEEQPPAVIKLTS